jgi:hypothetical protein
MTTVSQAAQALGITWDKFRYLLKKFKDQVILQKEWNHFLLSGGQEVSQPDFEIVFMGEAQLIPEISSGEDAGDRGVLPASCKTVIKASIESIHPLLPGAMCLSMILRKALWITSTFRINCCFLNVPRFNRDEVAAFEDGIVYIDAR